MKKIKTYEDFVNEEINLRKAAAGVVLGASLLGGMSSCKKTDIKPISQEVSSNQNSVVVDISIKPKQYVMGVVSNPEVIQGFIDDNFEIDIKLQVYKKVNSGPIIKIKGSGGVLGDHQISSPTPGGDSTTTGFIAEGQYEIGELVSNRKISVSKGDVVLIKYSCKLKKPSEEIPAGFSYCSGLMKCITIDNRNINTKFRGDGEEALDKNTFIIAKCDFKNNPGYIYSGQTSPINSSVIINGSCGFIAE